VLWLCVMCVGVAQVVVEDEAPPLPAPAPPPSHTQGSALPLASVLVSPDGASGKGGEGLGEGLSFVISTVDGGVQTIDAWTGRAKVRLYITSRHIHAATAHTAHTAHGPKGHALRGGAWGGVCG
jgi:hypothetical protein